jgi:hypothetical protein
MPILGVVAMRPALSNNFGVLRIGGFGSMPFVAEPVSSGACSLPDHRTSDRDDINSEFAVRYDFAPFLDSLNTPALSNISALKWLRSVPSTRVGGYQGTSTQQPGGVGDGRGSGGGGSGIGIGGVGG